MFDIPGASSPSEIRLILALVGNLLDPLSALQTLGQNRMLEYGKYVQRMIRNPKPHNLVRKQRNP